MQIIEAALAFAITMLVLSLIVSSLVEIVHRVLSMREAGLKFMLYQVFDQVLAKYISPAIAAVAAKANSAVPAGAPEIDASKLLETTRQSFVTAMSANRAPITFPLKTDTGAAKTAAVSLTSLTPAEFMERLGSVKFGSDIDVGQIIKEVNEKANTAATTAGGVGADMLDAVLKDIAQKFQAFGSEAGTYFESRARMLSVCVAIVLAFAIRVDAIELFNTYLRDPNARNSVIEQTQAVTAQYKAAKDAADALQKVSSANPPPSAEVQKQIEDLKNDWQSTVDSTRSTVKQYGDFGLPIGWTKQNATLNPLANTCSMNGSVRVVAEKETCAAGETSGTFGLWPVIKLIASLLLGGLLVGLGSPFWFDAVTGLTNIRNVAKDVSGGKDSVARPAAPPADLAKIAEAESAGSNTPDRPQPVTPVGAFNISQAAAAAPAAAAASTTPAVPVQPKGG